MAGWDVNVLVTGDIDARPLGILGARTLRCDPAFAAIKKEPWTQTLAVAADGFATDSRVVDIVGAAMDRGVEVTLWGDGWPASLDHRVDKMAHLLSAAARAFKTRALGAAAVVTHDTVAPTENYRGRARWYWPDEGELPALLRIL